ncbi:Pol polyprotein, putative [Perkinsus marinus ATCC 50983]|uniref:Pol polyprotein, putative n=1 Tax=Perkinsus marinus (strain ATCC 50983 / TXsc) TaxID=423536 RepID=C5KGU7_PERM5|nr:Pol polyprotein, putative [Perkinsus marinus ATCC 50983]EER16296.1 Pol polyprotein, putative [Perkinsus marinus ATCC 50983]|eukprot:XP_002784500.1 Pol polyprotein, putative [Perkinsus marinus ATCC 50983]
MNAYVDRAYQACSTCWESRKHELIASSANPRSTPTVRLEIVYSDFAHPPTSCGKPSRKELTSFVIFVCAASGFTVAVPTCGEDALSLSMAFITSWVPICGVPRCLFTDGGPAYRARLTELLTSALGINHSFSLPANPQSNGLSERTVGRLKSLMEKLPASLPWDCALHLSCYYHNHCGPSPTPSDCALGLSRGPIRLFTDEIEEYPHESIEELCQSYLDEKGYLRFERACANANILQTSGATELLKPGTKITWKKNLEIREAVVCTPPSGLQPSGYDSDSPQLHGYAYLDPNFRTCWIKYLDNDNEEVKRVPISQISLRREDINFDDQPLHSLPGSIGGLRKDEFIVVNVGADPASSIYVLAKILAVGPTWVDIIVHDLCSVYFWSGFFSG